jgi:lambda family phage portal protein
MRVPDWPPKEAAEIPSTGPRKVRRYSAAKPDRLFGGFSTFSSLTSPAEQLRLDLRGLIAHSRIQAQNNDFMKAFLSMCRRHIVGPAGIRLQMRARQPDGTLDVAANRKVEDAWQRWGRRGNCTVCGRYSWLDVQRIAATVIARDGNFLAKIRTGAGFGPFRFQLQLLTIDHLDIDLVEKLSGGSYIEGGIEFNEFGRPLAYHLWSVNPGDRSIQKRERVRVPASDIIHVYQPVDASQYLGEPWAHTALRRLNKLHDYEEAALVAAHAGAAKMGFLKPDIELAEGDDSEAEDPEIQKIAAGEIETLPAGWDFQEFNPGYPDGEMEPFIKVVLRGAAAGLGVAYSSLANDLEGANFSSLRAGLGEERDEWRVLQNFMAAHLHDTAFSTWLPVAMISGEVALPLEKISKFDAATWRPRGWRAVNPKDEAVANDTDLANGLRSPQEIVADRGEDLEAVYEQIAESQRLAVSYGLTFAGPLRPASDDSMEDKPEPEEG